MNNLVAEAWKLYCTVAIIIFRSQRRKAAYDVERLKLIQSAAYKRYQRRWSRASYVKREEAKPVEIINKPQRAAKVEEPVKLPTKVGVEAPTIEPLVELVMKREPYTAESVQHLCVECVLADCDERDKKCLIRIARCRDPRLPRNASDGHRRNPKSKAVRASKEASLPIIRSVKSSGIVCPKCGGTNTQEWNAFDVSRLAMCLGCKNRWSLSEEQAKVMAAR